MNTRLPRRQFLARLATLSLLPATPFAAGIRRPTPAQMEGPFYPVELPLDRDNDLTRVAGQPRPAHGVVTDLTGAVLDPDGKPVRNARVEI